MDIDITRISSLMKYRNRYHHAKRKIPSKNDGCATKTFPGRGGGGLKGKEMKEGISDKHTHNNCTSLSFLCSENSDTPLKSETLSGYIDRQPDDIPSLT